MNARIFPFSKWLVVDDTVEDADDIILAIEGLGGKADRAESIKAAEKLLKKNIYDICIVDCFYKGTSKLGVDLLPELRSSLPGLPVIMISNSDDIDLPAKVIRAGADIFCPKLRDSFSLTKILGAAAIQATAARKLKIFEFNSSFSKDIFLGKAISEAFEHSIRRKEERLLICGSSGTGKTLGAHAFAHKFLKHNFGSLSRNIVYHDCAAKSDEMNSSLIFGEKILSGYNLQLNLFERAFGGVLILDNIHALSNKNQSRMKSIFDSEYIPSAIEEGGLSVNMIKFVATYSVDHQKKMLPGFLESYAHREIDLPSISDLNQDIVHVIQFILSQFSQSNDELKITASSNAIDKMLDVISLYIFPANFRTLQQFIENALIKALADQRTQIYPNDIEVVGSMKLLHKLNLQEENEYEKSFEGEILEGRFGKTLLKYISMGENFEEAKDILRKIMIGVASKKFLGNKSKIASSLGISRQSLYDHEELE